MSRMHVEISGDLVEQIDEMIREGYYGNRTEAVNDALEILIKGYKKSKLHAKDRKSLEQSRSATPEDGGG